MANQDDQFTFNTINFNFYENNKITFLFTILSSM